MQRPKLRRNGNNYTHTDTARFILISNMVQYCFQGNTATSIKQCLAKQAKACLLENLL